MMRVKELAAVAIAALLFFPALSGASGAARAGDAGRQARKDARAEKKCKHKVEMRSGRFDDLIRRANDLDERAARNISQAERLEAKAETSRGALVRSQSLRKAASKYSAQSAELRMRAAVSALASAACDKASTGGDEAPAPAQSGDLPAADGGAVSVTPPASGVVPPAAGGGPIVDTPQAPVESPAAVEPQAPGGAQ